MASIVRKRKSHERHKPPPSTRTSKSSPSKLIRASSVDRECDSIDTRVIRRLQRTPGVVLCRCLTKQQMKVLIDTEAASNRRLGLPGLEIVNEGIRDVADRQHIIAIAHSPDLRHPPGPILVVSSGDEIVGEELWGGQTDDSTTGDSNSIILGRGLKLYRSRLTRLRTPLKIFYRPLRFPELETLSGVRDAISITVNTLTHIRLSQLIGWDPNDPNLGTVLIGFNESKL